MSIDRELAGAEPSEHTPRSVWGISFAQVLTQTGFDHRLIGLWLDRILFGECARRLLPQRRRLACVNHGWVSALV
jgi:hypothetical protein